MNPPAPSLTVRAESLPAPLARLREVAASGIVVATFERSAYLDLGGRIVSLASADLQRGPFVITVAGVRPFPRVPAGLRVALRRGELCVGPLCVDLRDAIVWDPTLPPAVRAGGHTAVRDLVIRELSAGAPAQSVAGLLDAAPAGRSDLARTSLLGALSRGLSAIDALLSGRAGPATVLPVVATEIAGRGPGLTPSGDDVLVGILHALSLWPGIATPGDAVRLRRDLSAAARPRTTRISAAYLEAAGCGWGSEPWHALVKSLSGAPEGIRAAVRRLLRVGETSGADALTGFCWAWRRLHA